MKSADEFPDRAAERQGGRLDPSNGTAHAAVTTVAQGDCRLPGGAAKAPPSQIRGQRTAGIVHPSPRAPILRLVPKVLAHDFHNPLQRRTRLK